MYKNSFLRAKGSRQGTEASERGTEITMYRRKGKADSQSQPAMPACHRENVESGLGNKSDVGNWFLQPPAVGHGHI